MPLPETNGWPDQESRAGRRESWDAGPLLLSSEPFHTDIIDQQFHLLNRDLVQFLQPGRLWQTLADEQRVEVFQI